jgi:hypothetical protein
LRIEDVRFTGLASVIRPVVNLVIGIIMPGDPENRQRARGEDIQYYWMSDLPGANMAANLRTQDITRITSTRQGDNWRIEVRIREEVNPVRTGSHARIVPIQTREEIIAEITGAGPINADPNEASVRYHSGFAWVVVNSLGQVTSAAAGFDVTAEADNARIAGIRTNVTAQQTSRWTYSNFGWR